MWCWQTSSAMGRMPLTDGLKLRTRQKISLCMRWNPGQTSLQVKTKVCAKSISVPGEPNYVGICLKRPAAALDSHSWAESRSIHALSGPTWLGSRGFRGKLGGSLWKSSRAGGNQFLISAPHTGSPQNQNVKRIPKYSERQHRLPRSRVEQATTMT